MTQCTHVPTGASGSSQINAKLFVLDGASCHFNAGETSAPSPVCLAGMGCWFSKLGLVSFIWASAVAASNRIAITARIIRNVTPCNCRRHHYTFAQHQERPSGLPTEAGVLRWLREARCASE